MKAVWLAVGFALGAVVTGSALFPALHKRFTARALAGDFRTLAAATSRVPDGAAPISFWGDSLTSGARLTPGHDFPSLIAFLYARPAVNRGVAGESSRQIRERMASRPAPNAPENAVVWAGRNDDLGDTAATEANIDAMVASLHPGSRVLVLGVLNSDTARERRGGDRYAAIARLNDELKARYGQRFVPIREILIAEAGPDEDDRDAVDADVVPPSLRIDALHLNERGQAAVAVAVERAMERDGW